MKSEKENRGYVLVAMSNYNIEHRYYVVTRYSDADDEYNVYLRDELVSAQFYSLVEAEEILKQIKNNNVVLQENRLRLSNLTFIAMPVIQTITMEVI